MNIFDYIDYRHYLRDRIDALRAENANLSIREILRRLDCSSPSYYKEVIVDAKKNMSISTARRFAAFLRLSDTETEFFILLIQYNQAKTELERVHFYEKLLTADKKPVSSDHVLNVNEYEYMTSWRNAAVRELLGIFMDFGNRSPDERKQLSALLRVPVSDRQIDDAVMLLEKLKFIKKNSRGNYRKTETTIKAEKKSPSAYQALCQFVDLGKSVINTTEPDYRSFKVAVLGLDRDTHAIIQKKLDEVCHDIVNLSGATTSVSDRLYALNIQFFPLTRLPEEKAGAK